MVSTKIGKTEEAGLDPWTLCLNAIRAPTTRDRYETSVAKFFNFIRIPGTTLEQKARALAKIDMGTNI
jgi:hypothetical protein